MEREMPKKKQRKPVVWVGALLFFLLIVYIGTMDSGKKRTSNSASKAIQSQKSSSSRQSKVKNAISYLNDIDEVAWVEVDNNNVYVGFDPVPSDMDAIIRAAAMNGNRAADFGVHVWAVKSTQRNWRPGQGSYLAQHSARHGKIID
jgi:hypothetical protein